MARMFPSDVPAEDFPANSAEDVMYAALRDNLPDDYMVFYSRKCTIINIKESYSQDTETDFTIFHPKKGILCIEAKNGQVSFDGYTWHYGSGLTMKNPFDQVIKNKNALFAQWNTEFGEGNDLLKRCKILHAVWFPGLSREKIQKMKLRSVFDNERILSSAAAYEKGATKKEIDKIFDLPAGKDITTNLSNQDVQAILNRVLYRHHNLTPAEIGGEKDKVIKLKCYRLLEEQKRILDFLEEQPTATVNGVAGSGKTFVALELARRLSARGDKVLFLCYNNALNKFLNENYKKKNENVTFETIDSFAMNRLGCSLKEISYSVLQKHLEDDAITGDFPYRHVLVDEGQDFGQIAIEEAKILETLESCVDLQESEARPRGYFYVFYDKLQQVQGSRLPSFIQNADCRLSLSTNCRNTLEIAKTSLTKLIEDRKITTLKGISGEPPNFYFSSEGVSPKDCLDEILSDLRGKGVDPSQTVILTCGSQRANLFRGQDLARFVTCGGDHNDVQMFHFGCRDYRVFTCRQYKGLEADAVVLVDVNKETLCDAQQRMNFYVGASRARLHLEVLTTLSVEECRETLHQCFKKELEKGRTIDLSEALAKQFQAKYTLL